MSWPQFYIYVYMYVCMYLAMRMQTPILLIILFPNIKSCNLYVNGILIKYGVWTTLQIYSFTRD